MLPFRNTLFFGNNMNNLIETNETKAAKTMSNEIIITSCDINNVLTTAKNVSPMFQTHYANMVTGEHGISTLIGEILKENNSSLPLGTENGEFRNVAIATSMFASEIIAKVEEKFTGGTIRYPAATILTYLSVFMFRKGTVGKIKLKGFEDANRTSPKPRVKYYLAQ